MEKLLTKWKLDDNRLTFPLRAGLAANSEATVLLRLVSMRIDSSFTIWSPVDDYVDMKKLNETITKLGSNYVYLDLPFSLTDGPVNIPDPIRSKPLQNKPVQNTGNSSRLSTCFVISWAFFLVTYKLSGHLS